MKTKLQAGNVPLIREDHPSDYAGYPFITLLQYRNQHLLVVVDNTSEKQIKAFVLDLCGPAHVDEEIFIRITLDWFNTHRDRYPLSFMFSQLGVSSEYSKIYRAFNTEFVTRVIGPLPYFEMEKTRSVKRRRKKDPHQHIKEQKL